MLRLNSGWRHTVAQRITCRSRSLEGLSWLLSGHRLALLWLHHGGMRLRLRLRMRLWEQREGRLMAMWRRSRLCLTDTGVVRVTTSGHPLRCGKVSGLC